MAQSPLPSSSAPFHREDLPLPSTAAGSPSEGTTFESIPPSATTSTAGGSGVSQSHHLSTFSFAMNYLAEEEILVEHIHNGTSIDSSFPPDFPPSLSPPRLPDQLPKILHKTEGSFSLSDIIAVIFHNQDQELRVCSPPTRTHFPPHLSAGDWQGGGHPNEASPQILSQPPP
jgi:hypothetical protein